MTQAQLLGLMNGYKQVLIMLFGIGNFGSNQFATPEVTSSTEREVWTEICKPKAAWFKVKPKKSTIKRCKQCQ